MRTIDGIRYISAKEYAEMMNLTVGRVSQIKSELPFVRIEEFGIEVINFDLLELQLKEKSFAQTKFETSNPIHTYSYKDLGNFFAKFSLDLVQFKGNAEIRIEELQTKNQSLQEKLQKQALEAKELTQTIEALENKLKSCEVALKEQTELTELFGRQVFEYDNKEEIVVKYEARILELEQELKNQTDLRVEFDKFKELIIVQLKK